MDWTVGYILSPMDWRLDSLSSFPPWVPWSGTTAKSQVETWVRNRGSCSTGGGFPLLLAPHSAGFSHSSSEEKKGLSMDPSIGVDFLIEIQSLAVWKWSKKLLCRLPVPVKKLIIQILWNLWLQKKCKIQEPEWKKIRIWDKTSRSATLEVR